MKATSRQITTYLIGANIAALVLGYVLRSPDLAATRERQASIRLAAQEASFDRTEAMQRAQTCILVRKDMPLTDGVSAYFSSIQGGKAVIDKKRPMPNGAKVCDTFGNTGIVDATDGSPIVSDIRSMPSEDMKEILDSRGLLKNSSPKNSKVKGKKS